MELRPPFALRALQSHVGLQSTVFQDKKEAWTTSMLSAPQKKVNDPIIGVQIGNQIISQADGKIH